MQYVTLHPKEIPTATEPDSTGWKQRARNCFLQDTLPQGGLFLILITEVRCCS